MIFDKNDKDIDDSTVLEFQDYVDNPMDEDEIDYYEQCHNESRIYRRKRFMRNFLILLLMTLFAVLFYVYTNIKVYDSKEVTYSDIRSESSVNYRSFANGVIKYAPDGALYSDKKGAKKWNVFYQMKKPTIIASDKYVLIADLAGSSAYLCSETKVLTNFSDTKSIATANVSNKGIVSIMTYDDLGSYIKYFNTKGELLAEGSYPIGKKRFPVSSDISEDAYRFAFSFLNFNEDKISSDIEVYDFNELGNSKKHNLIYEENIPDDSILNIIFMKNNYIVGFSEGRMIFYSNEKSPKKETEIKFNTLPPSILVNSEYVVLISDDEVNNNYKVEIYDYKGNLKKEYSIDMNYDKAVLAKNYVAFYRGNEINIYDFNGRLKFSDVLENDIVSLQCVNSDLDYLIVYDNKAEVIHLK